MRQTTFATTTTTTTTSTDRDAVICARGDIDLASAPALKTAVLACLDEGCARIEIDMRAVTFMDCSGVNAIIDARAQATAGSAVWLVQPSRSVLHVLRLAEVGALLCA
jgi:anti-sigma B factor antagonist